MARLRPLVEALIEAFDEDAGGYRQLLTIADPYERAVVSDLISKSAQGMADNLLEARIAQHELAALIGPAGLPMPTRATLRQHLRNGALIDMHLTTFVTALESSCDCLAALAIGVLRTPLPLKTAQFSQFNNLPNLVPLTPDLVRAWGDCQKLLDHHSTTPLLRGGGSGSLGCGTCTFTERARVASCSHAGASPGRQFSFLSGARRRHYRA